MNMFLLTLKRVLSNSTNIDSLSFLKEMLDRAFFCIEYYCICINLFPFFLLVGANALFVHITRDFK